MVKEKEKTVVGSDGIRRIWYNEEWYFSVIDVIRFLTGSSRPRKYWADLKNRLIEEGFQLSDFVGQLKMKSSDGKSYFTDCANKKGIFRIIQSIPSKRAEPFKLWLSKVGSDRIDEIENPELAQKRMKEIYEKKGYSKSWIDKRIRGIAVRQNLTDEWKVRGIERQSDFSILTAEISKATFGMNPSEYKKFKNLNEENLRDHMTDLELIFSMLGEASTVEIERTQNPESFDEHLDVSIKGGSIAKNALEELEGETGEKVVSGENYLEKKEKKIRKKKKKNPLEVMNEN